MWLAATNVQHAPKRLGVKDPQPSAGISAMRCCAARSFFWTRGRGAVISIMHKMASFFLCKTELATLDNSMCWFLAHDKNISFVREHSPLSRHIPAYRMRITLCKKERWSECCKGECHRQLQSCYLAWQLHCAREGIRTWLLQTWEPTAKMQKCTSVCNVSVPHKVNWRRLP